MSSGSLRPESPKDVQCEHCGLYYRNDGIRPHEDNCDRQGREPFQPLAGSEIDHGDDPLEDEVEASDPTPDGAGATPDAGDNPVDKPREVVSDGGPKQPPTPTVTNDDDQDDLEDDVDDDRQSDPIDDLPDRYVPVEDYLDAVADELEDEQVAALAAELESYDVVDVDETTETTLAAHTIDEVAT